MKLALGTVQFGLPYGIANQAGQASRSEAKLMLQLASASGIDTLDTAIAYGSSETCLGEAGVQGFKVVTKLPVVPDDCGDVSAWIQQQVNLSLLRLGVTAVYGLLLHRPDQLLGANGAKIYQALQALKDKGQVQKVGISIYAPSELEALIPRFPFDLVQAPFNLVDRRFYSTGWMQRLKDNDVEVHTRSAFLQGLLLMNQSDIPSKFSQWGGLWNSWHEWLSEQNGLALHACLAFSLSFPEIDRVIVGADTVSQLAEIVSAVNDHPKYDFPNIQCGDENLINPGRWTELR
ncbi:MAG: aldo/keto reductase [Candidatus Marinimicrobia bacterium]|nr:aldo/keto reductase [Candidatus Neomarinimicrobiota bacterium]